MSRIIPFIECVARPKKDSVILGLKEHLLQVKRNMEQMNGTKDSTIHSLLGLAALCHDIAKAHTDWQIYINNPTIKKGPSHSPQGAFLFSLLGYELLQRLDVWEEYKRYWIWFIRDIADHHGRLKDITNDEIKWIKSQGWEKCDLEGIKKFFEEQYPILAPIQLNLNKLTSWKQEIFELIEEVTDELDLGYSEWEPLQLMNVLQEWRNLTTSLIAGDRFDVKETNTVWIEQEDWCKYEKFLEQFNKENANRPFLPVRIQAQNEILQQLEGYEDHTFFTLEMPTGYGKTIASLQIAIMFGKTQQYRKVLYVAPYLSILEQTSQTIEERFQNSTLQHHSLSLLEETEQRTPEKELVMESWAHSIVCTSFQQFAKALFPSRAQDTLRRAFLQDCIIIIDEPQIFSPESWNVFLCGLQSMAMKFRWKVIFLSATMPPFQYGLTVNPVRLSVDMDKAHNRYQIINREKMDEYQLARFINIQDVKTKAVILNTIEDAYCVHEKIGDEQAFLLHGMMIPIHKKMIISGIQKLLSCGDPVSLVSTQIIEAGVDISFQHVIRALPILPSIIQAAGRVNRHGENKEIGTLSVVPFLRKGKIDTRTPIYNKNLQQITDQLLFQKEVWNESEMMSLVQQYYDEMFRQNTYENGLIKIRSAYEGRWSELSGFESFGEDKSLRLPIFIPWEAEYSLEEWVYSRMKTKTAKDNSCTLIPEQILFLRKKFQIYKATDIYGRYQDKNFLSKLNFTDRKAFMILFRYYVLNVPLKYVLKVVSKEDYLQNKIPILYGTDAYDSHFGLIAPYSEFDNII